MSKKILYISNFRDGTGYSHAAIGYTLSLDAAGYDVVIRNIKLNNTNGEVPERISELEKKSPKGCEIVIQHLLPHMMEYCGYFAQNIGLFAHETDSFGLSPWPNYLNIMDKLIVPNKQMQLDVCSRLKPPSFVIPHACNIDKYNGNFHKLNLPELHDKFVFYFIGENIRRKNLAGLLKAFHLEFSPHEPVVLLIKTSMPGLSPVDCGRQILEFTKKIKSNLKLYKSLDDYAREVIITDRLSEEDILNLHCTGDCFVNMSYGEAFCLPLLDAMGMGKPIISNGEGGPYDILCDAINKDTYYGMLIPNRLEPAFACTETFGDLNTSRENWRHPSINSARACMREIYENKEMRAIFKERDLERIQNYSYNKIGEKFKEIL